MLYLSTVYDPKRFGDLRDLIPGQTSPATSLAIRLVPAYLYVTVLMLQKHKEERFLFPAYGNLILNAAVTIYLARGLFEQAFIKVTKSPYRVSSPSCPPSIEIVLSLQRIVDRLPEVESSRTRLEP